jgi:hypothetical protein
LICDLYSEWAAVKVTIQSEAYPDFYFVIINVNLDVSLQLGSSVDKNQIIGKHIGSQTMSDISVMKKNYSDIVENWELISFFQVMTDTLFEIYENRGACSIDDFIISRTERDLSPCTCSCEEHCAFTSAGELDNFFFLKDLPDKFNAMPWFPLLLSE